MYRITITTVIGLDGREEKSHHHFEGATEALYFMAALETPQRIFVTEVSGHNWQQTPDGFRCTECKQYGEAGTEPYYCEGDWQSDLDAAYKQLAEDMEFESYREENR